MDSNLTSYRSRTNGAWFHDTNQLGATQACTVTRSVITERGRQLAFVSADRISQTRHILWVREGGIGNGEWGGTAVLPLTPALGSDKVLGLVTEDKLVVAPAGFLRACQAQFRTERCFGVAF